MCFNPSITLWLLTLGSLFTGISREIWGKSPQLRLSHQLSALKSDCNSPPPKKKHNVLCLSSWSVELSASILSRLDEDLFWILTILRINKVLDSEQGKFIKHAETCHDEDIWEQMPVLISEGERQGFKGCLWGIWCTQYLGFGLFQRPELKVLNSEWSFFNLPE